MIPYFGFAVGPQVTFNSRRDTPSLYDMIATAGADQVLMDLHADQIQVLWRSRGQHLRVAGAAGRCGGIAMTSLVVSPDVGGVFGTGAREAAGRCRFSHHRQAATTCQRGQVMNIIGDVSGRTCVLIDDIVDTAAHCAGGEALKEGRKGGCGYCTHPFCPLR